ncbi:hypothetical protein [Chitinophaga sp. MM2321]|uniref:hypothetical protein n=1 Tax=Chitinophaga sp. MM2321 TaxID=3137178 RepID=UPI0032D58712
MKKRLLELLVIYIIYLAVLLLYIVLHNGYIAKALSSLIIWLLPFIVILPTQFIAFMIGVGWPTNSDRIDTRIYRLTHLIVFSIIIILVAFSLYK